MNRKERAAAMATHPGVKPVKGPAVVCLAWRPEGKPLCQSPARWVFTPIQGKPLDIFGGQPVALCWTHMIHQGVYGDMDEEARTRRWAKRNGWEV